MRVARIRRFAEEKLAECVEIAEKKNFHREFNSSAGFIPQEGVHYELVLSNRLTSSHGMAGRWRGEYKIKISIPQSLKLFENTTEDKAWKAIENTITHEYAHLIESMVFGRSSHGSRWQRIHKFFGGSGEVYGSTFGDMKDIKAAVREYINKSGRVFQMHFRGEKVRINVKRINKRSVTVRYQPVGHEEELSPENFHAFREFRAGYSWFYKNLNLDQEEVEEAEELEEVEEGAEENADWKSTDLSSKARIYLAWKSGIEVVTELLEIVDHDVKRSTVKAWIRRWEKGKALPAIAKK